MFPVRNVPFRSGKYGGPQRTYTPHEWSLAFEASEHITAPLVALIVAQDPHQVVQRNDIQTRKEPHEKSEKGASTTTSTGHTRTAKSTAPTLYLKRRGPRLGSQPCLLLNMGFFYIRGNFMMRFVLGMGEPEQHTPFMQLWNPLLCGPCNDLPHGWDPNYPPQ